MPYKANCCLSPTLLYFISKLWLVVFPPSKRTWPHWSFICWGNFEMLFYVCPNLKHELQQLPLLPYLGHGGAMHIIKFGECCCKKFLMRNAIIWTRSLVWANKDNLLNWFVKYWVLLFSHLQYNLVFDPHDISIKATPIHMATRM